MRDKWLAFLLAGFGVMGLYRRRLRMAFHRWIDNHGRDGQIELNVRRNHLPVTVLMRRGNEGDYLMTSEFLREWYACPDFRPRTIIDAGANIGLFALHAARFYPQARLICFEPNAENVVQLKANLERNCISADINTAAVWSKSTTVYFHAQQAHSGYVDEIPAGEPMAAILPDIPPDCWLKLDVEGAEYQVLPALFAARRFPRWMSVELHNAAQKGQEIIDLLRENGYSVSGHEDLKHFGVVITACRKT